MNFLEKAKLKARLLKQEITALYYAYRNPKTGRLPKAIVFITLFLAISPIDLIPDFIPILGYLDDLIIIPLLLRLSIKLIPQEIMAESRLRAEKEPKILNIKALRRKKSD